MHKNWIIYLLNNSGKPKYLGWCAILEFNIVAMLAGSEGVRKEERVVSILFGTPYGAVCKCGGL